MALQPDQSTPQGTRQNFGDLGLSDSGLALKKQGTSQPQRQEHNRRQRA
jgi:hypothetical protein